MKRLLFFFSVAFSISSVFLRRVDFVNLSIGTGGEGFGVGGLMPGVQLPFGQIRASPDTAALVDFSWNHYGGYYFNDDVIKCFSQTHMVGSGVTDYGNICLMPLPKVRENPVVESAFSHKTEIMQPGFYSVYLDDSDINVEITASGSHVALYRFTYGTGASTYALHLDPTASLTKGACVTAHVEIDPENYRVIGWGQTKGSLTGRNGKGVTVYFVLESKIAFETWGVWTNGTFNPNGTESSGNETQAFVSVSDDSDGVFEVAVSISFVSIDQALINLQEEWNHTISFEQYKELAQNIWEEQLSLIDVKATDNQTLIKFYTGLYHSFMAPTLFSDINGKYLDMAGNVSSLPSGCKHYTDMSIWDIHRTQIPLLCLVQPSVATDIAKSLVRMYQDGGDLPRWPIANVYSGCMIGNHANIILLDVLRKIGNSSLDVELAYSAMKLQANDPQRPHVSRAGLEDYLKYGYVSEEASEESVSLTLAYAYDDWAVGEFAAHLGLSQEAVQYFNRSKYYANVWDADRKLMCPRRRNGTFNCPLNPNLNEWLIKNHGYTEGNAAQWTWFVPHDTPGLIKLFGGEFVDRLDQLIRKSQGQTSNVLPNSYYWAGNEPDILAPYLFNFAGRPDLTQKYVRWLGDHRYSTKPSGVPGNDDFGTLSSWYVWSVLGLYPLSGTTLYFIGSPRVSEASIHLAAGAQLWIFVKNAGNDNSSVDRVWVNGKPVDMANHPFVDHGQIARGGNITFWMASAPSTQ
eukprot:m.809 g.809  ORF g.809 m.809 type:complete len:745 (+) comp4904_c0_seq1:2-2236(+)